MIRKAVILVLVLLALGTLTLWVTSYHHQVEPLSSIDTYLWCANDLRSSHYVTSLQGWLRFGTARQNPRVLEAPADGRGYWVMIAVEQSPGPVFVKHGLATAYLGGLILVNTNLSTYWIFHTAFAVPHWFISLLLLTYPAITFARGPLRRRRRRKRGQCLSCGYNLTGNVSGVCPECSQNIEHDNGQHGEGV